MQGISQKRYIRYRSTHDPPESAETGNLCRRSGPHGHMWPGPAGDRLGSVNGTFTTLTAPTSRLTSTPGNCPGVKTRHTSLNTHTGTRLAGYRAGRHNRPGIACRHRMVITHPTIYPHFLAPLKPRSGLSHPARASRSSLTPDDAHAPTLRTVARSGRCATRWKAVPGQAPGCDLPERTAGGSPVPQEAFPDEKSASIFHHVAAPGTRATNRGPRGDGQRGLHPRG